MSLGTRAWKTVRHDIGRKLTALGLALGVWFVLEGLVLDEQSEDLDVEMVHSIEEADRDRLAAARSTVYLVVPEALQVERYLPETLRLRVKGLKEDVRGLVMTAVLTFDPDELKGEPKAVVSRTLAREDFRGRDRTPELTLFRIGSDATALLSVTLVRADTLDVTLGAANIRVTGQPAKGFVTDSAGARPRPNSVQVSGPVSVIEKFRTDPSVLTLSPVSVEGRNSTVTMSVGLAPEWQSRGVSLVPANIDVTVPVNPADKDKRLFGVSVTYKNEAALPELGFRLVGRPPEKLDVLLRGPAPELDRYTPEQLERQIDLVLDFRHALLTDGINRPRLDTLRLELSQEVKILDVDGHDEPVVEFKLEKVPKGP